MGDNQGEFICKITPLPVSEWIEKGEGCPPCILSPLSAYYRGILENAGEMKLAQELDEVYAGGDVLTIGQKLDSIKNEVGSEQLKQQLKNLDCFAQSFKPEDSADKTA
jgi:hypothetical protein